MTNENLVTGSESGDEAEVAMVTKLLSDLSRFDAEARQRIIETVATFYGDALRGGSGPVRVAPGG